MLDVLRRKEAADYLRVSLSTLKRMVASGAVKPIRLSERRVVFRRADLEKALDKLAKQN